MNASVPPHAVAAADPASPSPGAPLPAHGATWAERAVTLCGAAMFALWTWRFFPGGDLAFKSRVCAIAMVALGTVDLAVIWSVAARGLTDARVRRAWRLLAGGMTMWVIAGVLWELVGRPPLSVADLGQLAFFPLVLAAVLAFPATPLDREERVRFWLDTAILLASGVAGVWYFALWPALAQGTGDLAALVVNTLYPVGDLIMLFAASAALLRGTDASTRRALTWVAVGLIARFAGDLVYSSQMVAGANVEGGLADFTWVLSAWIIALGACVQRRSVSSSAPAWSAPRSSHLSFLPYASVVLAYAVLVATTHGAWSARVGGVLFSAIAVTALVLVRQLLATRDNVRLQRVHAAREANEAGEARFRSLVQHSSDIIIVVDRAGEIRYVSPAVERVLGIAPKEALGRSLLSFVQPDDAEQAAESLANSHATAGTVGPTTLRALAADGGLRRLECMATNLLDDPSVAGIVVTVRDVTERAALEAQLVHQAFHDPLTGLSNRTLFRDRVGHALSRDVRLTQGVAVLFLDLDDFKTVNDSLGHAAGDRLLRVVAERLLNATRGCDTVARLGGDEFGVLIENARTEEDAVIVAERVVQALRMPVPLDGQAVLVGASVGIALARPEDGAEELLRNADMAMYKAKQRGKSTHETFVPEMHAALVDRIELETDLRRAVEHGECAEFRVHYQPIVELAGGRPSGVEALVRWQHPRRGLVAPLTFIPVAESTGMIVPLGRWVLRMACLQAARWQATRDATGQEPPLTITVNISARQLQEPDLVDDVRAVLAETGLPAHALVLEITESVIIRDADAALEAMHALKALGVRLAIDDFGTGYSSLGYLQQFPIDILKIDKSFVDGVARGGPRAALARTIVALGDSLALHCVAEGIEHDDQREHLHALGCAYGQGFLFARPLPAEELEAIMCGPVVAV
jgi:diguanylate cyclase (GGDEF)-like protein/PAS domain S-box-containing protein